MIRSPRDVLDHQWLRQRERLAAPRHVKIDLGQDLLAAATGLNSPEKPASRVP